MKKSIKMAAALLAVVMGVTSGYTATPAEMVKAEEQDNVIIVIDPGHGGAETGAVRMEGSEIAAAEKNMNLVIAKALKKKLETYDGVTVYMTRTTDREVGLTDRVTYAHDLNADAVISIHNNAKGDAQEFTNGSSVLVSGGQYQKQLAKESWKLGKKILKQLEKRVGLENQGRTLRYSSRTKYPNGSYADYYGIIRQATEYNMMSMIIEHAFVDDDQDYELALSSNAKLKKLGIADAIGIAKYYDLELKDDEE